MPFRVSFRRFQPGFKKKGTVDGTKQTHGDHEQAILQLRNFEPSPAQVANVQSFQLGDLWHEAYEKLREEDEPLILAYEKYLLTQSMTQPGGQHTSNSFDNSHEIQLQHLVERRLAELQETRLRITVGGREVVVKDQTRRIIQAILSFKDAISSAVSSEPHAALAWAGVLMLLNPISRAITQEEDAMDCLKQISDLLIRYRILEFTHVKVCASAQSSSSAIKSLEEIHTSLKTKTINLYKEVLRYQMRLAKQYSQPGMFRFFKDSVAVDNWKDMLRSITEIDDNIKDDLKLLDSHTLKEINTAIEDLQRLTNTILDLSIEARDMTKSSRQFQLLDKLPCAKGAEFDSVEDRNKGRYLAGTQVEILTKIQEWIENPDGRHIFWLRGMPGTGKSTISRTFAAACHTRTRFVTGEPLPDNLCLGASFFFDRYDSHRNDAKRLFTTLAGSLTTVLPNLKAFVCDAIDRSPRIGEKVLEKQWTDLIFQPLRALEKRLLFPLTL